MSDRSEDLRRAIDSLGGTGSAAAALDISKRAVQRAYGGDATDSLRDAIFSAVRVPLFALENVVAEIAGDGQRVAAARVLVLIMIARRGEMVTTEVGEALNGDPNSSAADTHLKALRRLGYVEGEIIEDRGSPTAWRLSSKGRTALGIK